MYEFYAHSEQGPIRTTNEDCFLVNNIVSNQILHQKLNQFKFKNRNEFVVAIADGVGGRPGGEFASNYVLKELATIQETDYQPIILDKIHKAHQKLRNESIDRNLIGSSTTLTLLTALNEYITIYHVGDTRAYKLTPTKLIQLTSDQTQLQKVVDELPIFNTVKKYLPNNNVLLEAMGATNELPSVSIIKTTIEPDDILLLTSDGIHDYLSKTEIELILRKYKSIKTIVKKLISSALNHTSQDNMTAIGIHFKR